VYGDAEARRLPAATVHTALPFLFMGAGFGLVQLTELESLPVIVKVIGPVALVAPGAGVLNGLSVAVNVAA
jgi:hypothetical protein